jgi:DNA-binding GntR family transcriptional regulator
MSVRRSLPVATFDLASVDPGAVPPAIPLGARDQSLSEKVYDYLVEEIIEGRLQPGERLVEREIVSALNVSRTPLREALPQLEAHGFIRTIPRRGAIVAQLTLKDVDELFDVRESLEVLAARLAASRADNASIARLEARLDYAREVTESGSLRDIAAANAAIHGQILNMAQNGLLAELMRPLSGRVRWLFRLTSDRDPWVMCKEHEDLYHAIRDRQPERAAEIAYHHVASGREPSRRILSQVLGRSR